MERLQLEVDGPCVCSVCWFTILFGCGALLVVSPFAVGCVCSREQKGHVYVHVCWQVTIFWCAFKMDCSPGVPLLLGAFAVGGNWLKRVCLFVGSATCRVLCSSWVRMQPQATRPSVCICLLFAGS